MYTLFCEQKNTYYGQELCAETLFSGVHCSQSCEALIHSYFTWGHKHELFHLNFIDQYIARGKHTHTVSLYLLGIALAGLFQDPVYRHLQSFLPELDGWYDKDRDASYTWFLTCLYHDVASCIEQTKIPEDPTERQKTLLPLPGVPLPGGSHSVSVFRTACEELLLLPGLFRVLRTRDFGGVFVL